MSIIAIFAKANNDLIIASILSVWKLRCIVLVIDITLPDNRKIKLLNIADIVVTDYK